MKFKRKVYLASPFFNEEQVRVVRALEKLLSNNLLVTEVFSPSRDGTKLVMGESTFAERKQVFLDNCHNIDDSALVLAFASNNDQGTYWEIGRAISLGIPVIVLIDTKNSRDVFEGLSSVLISDVDSLIKDIEEEDEVNPKSMYRLLNQYIDRDLSITREVSVILPDEMDANPLDVMSGIQTSLDDEGEFTGNLRRYHAGAISVKDLLDKKPAVIAISIDNRDPNVSKLLGQLYASEYKNRVITFSTQGYGVNLMLQHSIVSHSTDYSNLAKEIIRLSTSYDYQVDESHYRSTEEFE